MRISDWSSDVCSSDLIRIRNVPFAHVLPNIRSCPTLFVCIVKQQPASFFRVKIPNAPGPCSCNKRSGMVSVKKSWDKARKFPLVDQGTNYICGYFRLKQAKEYQLVSRSEEHTSEPQSLM